MHRLQQRVGWRAVVAALAVLAIMARLIPGPRTIDDAYITFRYARNILRGDGFVYNPGEPVLGTTTPLYTLLLVVAGALTGEIDFPVVAPIINALADAVSVVLLVLISRRLMGSSIPALIVGLLWAVSPRSVWFAIAGMETSVVVMLMLGAFAAWLSAEQLDERWRYPLIAVLVGLAILTRPDTIIWAGPLALAMIWERVGPLFATGREAKPSPAAVIRTLPWRELGITLAVIAPWVIYGTLTFGSPLTRSFIAKLAAYAITPGIALANFAVNYGIPFYEQLTFGDIAALIGVPIYIGLAVVGAVSLVRATWRSIPLVIFPWVYAAVFGVANPPMFGWYVVPPMPIYILCIIAGLWALFRPLSKTSERLPAFAMGTAGAICVFFSLNAWTLHPKVPPDLPAPQTAWNLPEVNQSAAGDLLRPLARPDKVIAVADIGAVGWASDARILDVVGLVSPEVTAYYPVDAAMIVPAAGFAISPELIFDMKPDFIVFNEAYGQLGLMLDPRFDAQYRLLKEYPMEVGHSRRLLVFERRAGN